MKWENIALQNTNTAFQKVCNQKQIIVRGTVYMTTYQHGDRKCVFMYNTENKFPSN